MVAKTERKRWVGIGVISEGTLKSEDLYDAYLSALQPVQLTREERQEVRMIERWNKARVTDDFLKEDEQEVLDNAVDDLAMIIEDHVPPLCRFGSQEGDGACFGVWPNWGIIDMMAADKDLWKGSEPPLPQEREPGCDYWLEVNDHGNATLYRWAGNGKWVELWSVV